jgi:predicted DCC family thiol-disulfide oxidoreductase YuxK
MKDMHVADRHGAIAAGFDAYRALAWIVPIGWLTLPILYCPGVAPLGRHAYRWFADHRTHVCRIDENPRAAIRPETPSAERPAAPSREGIGPRVSEPSGGFQRISS